MTDRTLTKQSAHLATPPHTSLRLPRNVRMLGWVSLLNDVASEMIYPLMPQFLITVLCGNRIYLGAIEGLGESVASLLKLWSGTRSDVVTRRKPFVVVGYWIAAVARPLMAFTTAPWQLFLTRLADRTGKGIRTSPRDALVADSTLPDHRGRAFGFQRAMDNLGAALGPVLAAVFLWIWPDQLRLLFLATLIPGVLVIALVTWGLTEASATFPLLNGTAPTSIDETQPLSKQFHRYLLALLIFTLGNSSDAFLLVRAGELGVPIYALPLLWFAFHLVKSAGNVVVGSVVDRAGGRLPLMLGWSVYAGCYLAFAFATKAWHAWAFFMSYGIFYALTEPSEKTLVAALGGRHQHGRAFGWYNFSIGICALPSSLIFGWLYETTGPGIAFSWGASLAFVAAVILLTVRVPAQIRPEQSDTHP